MHLIAGETLFMGYPFMIRWSKLARSMTQYFLCQTEMKTNRLSVNALAESLEGRRLFSTFNVYYGDGPSTEYPESVASGVTANWSQTPASWPDPSVYLTYSDIATQASEITLTLTGLPAHTMARVNLSEYHASQPYMTSDADQLVVVADENEMTLTYDGIDGANVTGSSNWARWFGHSGSSMTVTFSSEGLENYEMIDLYVIRVDLYHPTASVTGGGTHDEGDTPIDFTVSRDLPTGWQGVSYGDEAIPDTTVDIDVGGTATPTTDYVTIPNSVTIDDNDWFASITRLAIADSDDLELDETIEITLSANAAVYNFPTTVPAGPATAPTAVAIIAGRNGFADEGRVGEAVSHWVAPGATAGGQGNQGVGSIQAETAPEIETWIGADGLARARVKAGTGLALVVRSYTGQKAGDQGTGAVGSAYAGKKVFITPQLAADIDKHEQGHVTATGNVFTGTLKLAIEKAAHYRANDMVGAVAESEAVVKARLLAEIDWTTRRTAFVDKDTFVNDSPHTVAKSFHGWETAQGGGPLDWLSGPGVEGGVTYDFVLKSREETDPAYNLPNYIDYDPWVP